VGKADTEREMSFPVPKMDSASETMSKPINFWCSDQCSDKSFQVPYKPKLSSLF